MFPRLCRHNTTIDRLLSSRRYDRLPCASAHAGDSAPRTPGADLRYCYQNPAFERGEQAFFILLTNDNAAPRPLLFLHIFSSVRQERAAQNEESCEPICHDCCLFIILPIDCSFWSSWCVSHLNLWHSLRRQERVFKKVRNRSVKADVMGVGCVWLVFGCCMLGKIA